jgi:hypothetical protein
VLLAPCDFLSLALAASYFCYLCEICISRIVLNFLSSSASLSLELADCSLLYRVSKVVREESLGSRMLSILSA